MYLSLSVLIHLGVSQLFAGSTTARREPPAVQVSLVSRVAPEKPAVEKRQKPVPRQKHEPPAEPRKTPPEVRTESEPQVDNPGPVPQESVPPVSTPAPSAAEHSQRASTIASETAANLYRFQVLEIIRKNLRYPGNARRRGIEGTVSVRFVINGSGVVGDIQVLNSSGSALLDRASLETIRRCAFPSPPGSSMTLRVPITFRLDEEM